MKKSKLLLTLFISFFKIGAFTFGGGYAMLSLLENEFVSKRGWLSKDEFLDMLAIAEGGISEQYRLDAHEDRVRRRNSRGRVYEVWP